MTFCFPPARVCGAILVAMLFSSCMHVREKSQTYIPSTAPVEAAGVQVSGQFDPREGDSGLAFSAMVYAAASTSLFGPYEFTLFAIGAPERDAYFYVNQLRYVRSDGSYRVINPKYLGYPVKFSPTRKEGVVQAAYHAPGVVGVDFARVDAVVVEADIVISAKNGVREKAKIQIPFKRATVKRTQFLSVPGALVDELRHRGVPFEDEDVGVNRPDWGKKQE